MGCMIEIMCFKSIHVKSLILSKMHISIVVVHNKQMRHLLIKLHFAN